MHGHHHGYLDDKDAYLSRLRRIEGQVRGIARMVEEENIDILTHTRSAATSAPLIRWHWACSTAI